MNTRKTIVVSAVNLRKGGTLAILRECLSYLSSQTDIYRVVALVHKKELCQYPGIEYIEMPDVARGWCRRLWCEYVTMHSISIRLSPVFLWLSLHDTTPRVRAERQAVYCQTSFPFLRWSPGDFLMDFKIPLFAMLTKYAYKININSNKYLIVQAGWLRIGLSKMLGLPANRFIIAPPERKIPDTDIPGVCLPCYTFLYAATPDCHKNFETLCRAAALLEEEMGTGQFKVILTINGRENKYSKWLFRKWGTVDSIDFAGFMTKDTLYNHYKGCDCLVFPSRIETWGLPVSEFSVFGKPMLLANLPYAHETAAGCGKVSFFDPQKPEELKNKMKRLMTNDSSFLNVVAKVPLTPPFAQNWDELFNLLLDDIPIA